MAQQSLPDTGAPIAALIVVSAGFVLVGLAVLAFTMLRHRRRW